VNGARSIVADGLKMARIKQGVSLRDMAERLGVVCSAVVRYEDGHNLNEKTIVRYAAALELDVEIRLVPREAANG
jgi:transcriptional regulator with XRE-family HTH domain